MIRFGPISHPRVARPRLRAYLPDGGVAEAPLGEIILRPDIAIAEEARSAPDRDHGAYAAESVALPPAARNGRSDQPLVGICMATHEPPLDLFERQVRSLREQTYARWVCLVSDDQSSPERFTAMREILEGDERFIVRRSPTRLGSYLNFERALTLVPREAEWVALCDQDDRWYPEKLATLVEAMRPGVRLAYSDMRVVDRDGRILSETYWTYRRNNHTNLASLLLSNTVTGAASLLTREVLDYALPFPPRQGGAHHDHWLALVALSLGQLNYVDRPLYDYVQHDEAAVGHEGANIGGVAARRRDGVRSAPYWPHRVARRAVLFYLEEFCWMAIAARVLEIRCGARMMRGKLRSLRRFDDSGLAMAWMAVRTVRHLVGRNETLAREPRIVVALAWRRWLNWRKLIWRSRACAASRGPCVMVPGRTGTEALGAGAQPAPSARGTARLGAPARAGLAGGRRRGARDPERGARHGDGAMTAISVIIPTRDRHTVLLETLDRVERQAGDAELEVIVVDDGSSDGTRAAVGAWADEGRHLTLRLFEQEARGPAAARNRGIAAARAPVCLFLGDDTWPVDGLIARHAAFHGERPAAHDALLGRVSWAPPLDTQPFMRWLDLNGVQFDYESIPRRERISGGFLYTSNVSIKTAFLLEHGGFDEDFRDAAFEDIELGLRLEQAGMRLAYDPDARVEHWHPTDLPSALRRMWAAGRGNAQLVARHPERWPAPRPPSFRHSVKAGALTVLNLLGLGSLQGIRDETWRFLCHQAHREAFWSASDERPARHPRRGALLARLAARDEAAGGRRGVALDQLVRYVPVLELVRETDGSTLLDVGSGSAGLAPWLGPEWSITAVDESFSDYGGAIAPLADDARRLEGDARELPFEDRTFDVTVAIDMVEHVPPDDRARVLSELGRVTARRLIVAGPTGEPALDADRRLAHQVSKRGVRPPVWLEDHLAHGFPEREEIAAALRPHGAVRVLDNDNVRSHERLMRLETRRVGNLLTRLAATLVGRAPRPLAAGLLRLTRGRDRPPVYRTIVVLDRPAGERTHNRVGAAQHDGAAQLERL